MFCEGEVPFRLAIVYVVITPELIGALTQNVGQLCLNQQNMQAQNAQTQAMQAQVAMLTQVLANNNNQTQNNTGLEKVAQGLKPPLFSGEKDSVELDTWLFQVKDYFQTVAPVPEEQRVRAAGLMLKGQAASWYRDAVGRDQSLKT